MTSNLKKGVFINTAKASCSIHESGIMVHSCLAAGEGYSLDYYSTDIIDLDVLASEGKVRLRAPVPGVEAPQDHYDFWVFNWHFYTMAIHLDPAVIAALSGPKFTVVLELAPGDPLQLVPDGVFDAYIALDPDAVATNSIYPFPRPLDGTFRTPTALRRPIPVIGSFGYSTPGKGFENLVQAVNEEFDQAIVRINIPTGDHIGSLVIHSKDYARYLEEMCQRIAKPGVEVRFTYDFMTAEQLIDWCADNDLNCFMYTRCQPGLSATTDQAIMSGRPLVTSSNDTFRHIHRYIDPYPLTSLRGAIETTTPKVQAMQRDWAKTAFNARFAKMLADYGVFQASQVPPQPAMGGSGGRHEVLVATTAALSHGILDRPQRLANALHRTGQYHVTCIQCADLEELGAMVSTKAPAAIVLSQFDRASTDAIEQVLASFSGPILLIGGANREATEDQARSKNLISLPSLPIVPYFTVTSPLDIPTIWLIGFASEEDVLRVMLDRAAREMPGVRICVQLTPDMTSGTIASINRVCADVGGITVETHMPAGSGEAAIHTFALSHMIVVRNVDGYSDQLQNQAELAMITERAVVFSREARFPALAGREVFVEDYRLPELVELGVSAQMGLLQDFAESSIFAKLHRAIGPALAHVPTRDPAEFHERDPNDDALFLRKIYKLYLGRLPDPSGLQHYLGQLKANVSRDDIEADIKGSSEAQARGWTQAPPEPVFHHIGDLFSLDDEAFVRGAYDVVLGRKADAAGFAHHMYLLQIGETRDAIISGLCRSPEGIAAAAEMPGLAELVHRHERARIGWRAWLPRNRRQPVSIQRSLNVVEHRLSALVTQVEAVGSERAALQAQISEMRAAASHVIPAPVVETAPIADPQPVTMNAPRSERATVYVAIGMAGRARSASPYVTELVRACLAEGRPLRLIEWNIITKHLQYASQDVLEAGSWKDLPGLNPAEYPPHAGVQIVLDKGSVDEANWLLVPACLRRPDDPDIKVEVDFILEARRIGLHNSFVFHGAGALRDPSADRRAVACQDQYMQALLLADSIVATSDPALDEIEHYFSACQHAGFAPPRVVVPVPESRERLDWKHHAQSLLEALQLASSDAPFLTCYVFADDADGATGEAGDLRAALCRLRIDARKAKWNIRSSKLQLDSKVVSAPVPGEVGQRTSWLIVKASGPHSAAMVDAARKTGLRVAIMLEGEALPEESAISSEFLRCLGNADKIICDSEAAATRIWHILLGTRLKFLAAEDRIAVVDRVPSWRTDVVTDDYARKIARLLSNDRLGNKIVPLASRKIEAARVLMPQIQSRPKLSLCISTYNRARWLRVGLENIFRQIPEARTDLEVLVVDNCSVDDTPDVGKQFAHRADFRFVRNPVNVGMLGNLAVTAQQARGDYVWILGDDDLTRNGVIENILRVLNEHPELELIYMNYGYTSDPTPDRVEDLDRFLDEYNVLQPACPDELGTVASLAAKTENFYTAIYSHVYRRDHAMRSYCQDTSGRIFATMRACIPTSYYVLHYMADAPAYWLGEQALVVNSNVSWADYGPLLDLEHLPATWDLAERIGCPVEEVEMRRANRLWLVEMMWRDIFENDKVGNSAYFSAARVIMRLRHVPEFEKHVPEFRRIYTVAHEAGNPAAALVPSILFGAFEGLES